MKSIKFKLLIAILLILSIFIGGILTYGLTFKSYYQGEKFSEMKKITNDILGVIEENNIQKAIDKIELIAEEGNLQFGIEDNVKGNVVFTTHTIGKNNMMGGPGGHNRFPTLKVIDNKEGIENLLVYDKATGVNFLSTKTAYDNGRYSLIIRTPISEIDDAVSKSMKLLIMILVPITIVVLIITIIFSNYFTKPIIAITKKTSKIEKLNFSQSLDINSKDEIGTLAESVNNLSNTIESALKELKDKNLSLEIMIQNERKNDIIRREFVSSVSHELKSPIAVISGYAQMLTEGIITADEDKRYYLNVINEESDRMQVIVNDLLDLYKLESNTFKLAISEVDVANLINKIIKKNMFKFKEKEISVVSNIEPLILMADEIRLEQAIQNYINNALSHIDKNKILEINLTSSGFISVFNSGKNIEEDNLEKIWQGFVRVDKVRNYKEKRVGLGLAIVKQIVSLHGGECGVDNKGDGVEFWIKL